MIPSSVKPETLLPVMPEQITFPEESVVKALEPEQVRMVEILAPPPEITSPEARVFVAAVLVWRMLPPEIVRPEAEESPPEVSTLIPPAKVEVAVLEALIGEPICRSPETLNRPPMVELA